MNLVEASEYHLREIQRVHGHAADHSTIRLYRGYEHRHLAYLELSHLQPTLAMLNPAMVADCQLWIREVHSVGSRDGRAAERVYARIMRIWSRFLCNRHIIPVDLLDGFALPRLPKIRRRAFTQDEARAILAAVSQGSSAIRDRAIMLLLADTGCRVGELCGLELDDVLQPDGNLRGAVMLRKTKGGVPRDVVVHVAGVRGGGPCLQALHHWLSIRTAQPAVRALFTTFDGWPMSERRVRELHSEYGQIAHVHPCHPHLWRHTAATEALAEGVPENSIRDRLGHVSPEVLHDYLHQSDRTRDVAASKASLSTKWNLGSAARPPAARYAITVSNSHAPRVESQPRNGHAPSAPVALPNGLGMMVGPGDVAQMLAELLKSNPEVLQRAIALALPQPNGRHAEAGYPLALPEGRATPVVAGSAPARMAPRQRTWRRPPDDGDEHAAADEDKSRLASAAGLTVREHAVLELLAEGLTNAQIGEGLAISSHTAEQYVRSLMRKLQARNRTHAAAIARRRGLVPARQPRMRKSTEG